MARCIDVLVSNWICCNRLSSLSLLQGVPYDEENRDNRHPQWAE